MARITLPERCDRTAVETLLPDFAALSGTDRIEVDARAVAQVGQAMLQLLVSARNSVGHMALHASQPLREAVSLAGLSHILLDEARA